MNAGPSAGAMANTDQIDGAFPPDEEPLRRIGLEGVVPGVIDGGDDVAVRRETTTEPRHDLR